MIGFSGGLLQYNFEVFFFSGNIKQLPALHKHFTLIAAHYQQVFYQ